MGINDSKVQNLSNDNTDRPNDWKSFKISVPSVYPFQMICADYFCYGGHNYLVIVDRYSGWPYVCQLTGASPALVKKLREFFVTYGIAEELSSDGGPEFTAALTQQFLRDWGVAHRLSSVAYPHSNTRAEIGVKSAKRLIMENTGTGTTIGLTSHADPECRERQDTAANRENIRAWHNDESRQETYNAQRDNNGIPHTEKPCPRRTYRYEQPSHDGEYGDERTRPNTRAWHNDENRRETYNAQRDQQHP